MINSNILKLRKEMVLSARASDFYGLGILGELCNFLKKSYLFYFRKRESMSERGREG